jgi:tetratricopeptide (TPR) repeat protein
MKYLSLIILIIIISCKQDKLKSHANNINYEKAKIFRDSKVLDSAFYYYNLAKNDYIKTNDSLGTGKSFVNMAMIQTNQGDFFGGIESSLEATKFLRKQEDSTTRNTLATNYNNIALAFNFLKNYEKSLQFYYKTLTYVDNDEAKFLCYNNIGDVLITQGKFKLAEKYLEKAILTKNTVNYSKALNNLAKAKYLNNKKYNPLPELYKALEIRIKNGDESGLNSSYETLSEYFAKKDKTLSLFFAEKMLRAAINTKSSSDQILALKKIIELDPSNYLKNFQKLYSINNDLQTNRNKAKNQFAFIRYDVEKLKADKAEKDIEVLQKNISIIGLSFIVVGGFFWYKKRKKRLQQEKELEIKNTQLKISKKVHDVVANGIYQVMTKIENQENFNKDEALDELEFVYEKSRDISYEKEDSKNSEEEFKEKISNLIASFKNSSVETYVAGNENQVWSNLSPSTGEEIYQIIRELLVNMKKHSKADRVVFKFERIDNLIKIQYTDNGIGISGDLIYKNGLSSTVSRMEKINGEITFDIKTEKGLKINISFPIS